MARPLPKTNAPALVKNQNICQRRWSAEGAPASIARGNTAAAGPLRRIHWGGALANHTTQPAARNNSTTSDSIAMVTAALTKKMDQSSQSLPSVLLVSL